MKLELDERVVVITGAASGIGLACVRAFIGEGARVVAADINEALLHSATEDLPQTQLLRQYCDVSDHAQVEALIGAATRHWGRLDVMFSNAGGAMPTPLLEQPLADYRHLIGLNLDSVYFGIRAALPVMLKQGKGCFLTTSSGAGINAVEGLAIYGAAKAGVASLMKSVANEYGRQGIRANTIAPGPMLTPAISSWLSNFDDGLARYGAQVPSGRMGTAEDIAQAALFLASDAADYINGVELAVDGAIHARLATPQIS